jgi:transglutaminase-like putative cysteine protease
VIVKKEHGAGIILVASLLIATLCLPCISNGQQRSLELKYSVTVKDISEQAVKVSIWIPLPRSNTVQKLLDFQISDDTPYTILTDREFNNKFLYFKLPCGQIETSEISLTATFQVNRKSYKSRGRDDDIPLETDESFQRFLGPNELVPIDGKIAQEALSVAGDVKEPSDQMKVLFDHIVDTVNYDKSGTGWGLGDAIYACDIRAGNCTDFHSLFIGQARSLGIPARFLIGFPLPPDKKSGIIKGYHCWGEFYIEDNGWIPIDASEARKHLERREEYFANLDTNRVSFTLGRDIQLPKAQSNPVKNYVIYPYAEVDGKEIPVEWRMEFRDL